MFHVRESLTDFLSATISYRYDSLSNCFKSLFDYRDNIMEHTSVFYFVFTIFVIYLLFILQPAQSLQQNEKREASRHRFQWNRRRGHSKSDNSFGTSADFTKGLSDASSLLELPHRVRNNIANRIKASYAASKSSMLSWSSDDLPFSVPLNFMLSNKYAAYDDFWLDLENEENNESTREMREDNVRNYCRDKLHTLPNATTITSFCFLIHGHRGLSRDLSYMQAMMKKEARAQTHNQWMKCQARIDVEQERASSFDVINDTFAPRSEDSTIGCDDDPFVLHDLVVHSVTYNEKRTDDGVAAGGNRIADEIIAFILEYMASNDEQIHDNIDSQTDGSSNKLVDITISLVGNSLGGLYARYAVGELASRLKSSSDGDTTLNRQDIVEVSSTMVLGNRYRLHWNIFCTTATPHLGLSGHTFLPLPRSAELGVARVLGETGLDLFRLNSLLHTMATNSTFTRPLALFRKRIAYANAYGTDFPVPASTAAFLSESSSYPHHFDDCDINTDDQEEDDPAIDGPETTGSNPDITKVSKTKNKRNLFVATLRTPILKDVPGLSDHYEHVVVSNREVGKGFPRSSTSIDNIDDELARMSTSLDSLGWKKVFVDVRKDIPRISFSTSSLRRRLSSLTNMKDMSNGQDSSSNTDDPEKIDSSETPISIIKYHDSIFVDDTKSIERLKEIGIAQSKDVAAALSTTPLVSADSDEISLHWPAGHNMIVAFSRSKWSAYMNKAGRPVVDALAKEIVNDIFAFRLQEEN